MQSEGTCIAVEALLGFATPPPHRGLGSSAAMTDLRTPFILEQSQRFASNHEFVSKELYIKIGLWVYVSHVS